MLVSYTFTYGILGSSVVVVCASWVALGHSSASCSLYNGCTSLDHYVEMSPGLSG